MTPSMFKDRAGSLLVYCVLCRELGRGLPSHIKPTSRTPPPGTENSLAFALNQPGCQKSREIRRIPASLNLGIGDGRCRRQVQTAACNFLEFKLDVNDRISWHPNTEMVTDIHEGIETFSARILTVLQP
ncbi:hypothetical protein B0T17DRAFT_508628 [Bombardia bombarda]|uniref:Uncharacterized protein n=1 Tax=Bombardia bombarda TaxID=252184 RepID=A0AA40C1G2_9PEZI|nr:hypothetical protein B0T17DRAFT_508628 [Bombardia bombarda]